MTFQITGFMPSGGEVGPPKRSFGLAETELTFSANIDPYFRGVAIAALTPENEVEVEEAYFQTLALPQGFTLKGGRFLSGIGYQNEIHQHAWDFQDAPLPYKAFLGGRLSQDGVQLRWFAPTPILCRARSGAFERRSVSGLRPQQERGGRRPLFRPLGGDIGASYAWRAGVSTSRRHLTTAAMTTSIRSAAWSPTDSPVGAKLWAADAMLKWAPNRNPLITNFKLQGEYFRFRQDGSLDVR